MKGKLEYVLVDVATDENYWLFNTDSEGFIVCSDSEKTLKASDDGRNAFAEKLKGNETFVSIISILP